MENELVSVIVPIYNVEKYLDRCIQSIIGQTYRNLEIILVDDGSPDNCPQMCDDWAKKDSRIRVVHKENQGLGMARNTGIENACGQYICFFDSDDYVDLTTIEKAYACAKENCADIVVFGMNSVDANGQTTGQTIPVAEQLRYTGETVQKAFLPDLIDSRDNHVKIRNLCLSACSCLISMELIKRTVWRFVSERQIISEDSYSLIWLYKHVNTVAILPEALYCYCLNETSLTHTYRKDRYKRIRLFYHECRSMARNMGYNQEVEARITGLFLSFSIAAMKQIVMADIKRREQKYLLAQIIDDDMMQQALRESRGRYKSYARRIMFWAMRKKLYGICSLLLAIQNTKSKE